MKKLKCWKKSEGKSKIAERFDRIDGKGYIHLNSRENTYFGKRPKAKPNAKWDTFAVKNNSVQLSGSKLFESKKEAFKFAYKYMKKHDRC